MKHNIGDIVNVCPVSKKAKSRIGMMRPAIVEQVNHNKIFINFINFNYCCWTDLDGGLDWKFIQDE